MLLTELFSLYHRINFSKALYICVHKLYNKRKRAFQASDEVLMIWENPNLSEMQSKSI